MCSELTPWGKNTYVQQDLKTTSEVNSITLLNTWKKFNNLLLWFISSKREGEEEKQGVYSLWRIQRVWPWKLNLALKTLPATSAVFFQKIQCTNIFFKCLRLCNGSEEQLHILGAALLSVGWMVGGIVYCNFFTSMLHFLHLSETGEKSACSDKSKTMRQ